MTPTFIRDAATQALDDGKTFYTYARGIPALREAIAAFHQRTLGVDRRSGAHHRAGRRHAGDRDALCNAWSRPATISSSSRRSGPISFRPQGRGRGRPIWCGWTRIGQPGAGASISTNCSTPATRGPRRSSLPRPAIPPAGSRAGRNSRRCWISRARAASPSSATKSMARWFMTAAAHAPSFLQIADDE